MKAHPIIATFLLTGGRKSEVLGLDMEDVSFDRGIIRFRPNEHRGLETQTSQRTVPLWPRLRDILQRWLFARETPRTSAFSSLPPSQVALSIHPRRSCDRARRP